MAFIRMDDFPHGDKRRFSKKEGYVYKDDKPGLTEILKVLEKFEVLYKLGVSPLLLRDKDIDFLNENVKYGEVCMHGFDHGFSSIEPWPENLSQWTPIWMAGGEFRNMTEDQIDEKYETCKKILLKVDKYRQEDFILPFDVTTQELINVISKKGIKRLHSSDICYKTYKLKRFDYLDIELVRATWQHSYDFAKEVVKKLQKGVNFKNQQIGLHWIFEVKYPRREWFPYFVQICKLKENYI